MKPYKIVIVEDEELIREELKTLLINAGYVVDCVTNFAKTIDYIKSAFPDLILLDINLPEQDGYRLCSSIRSFSTTPILFITGRNTTMDELQALTLGGEPNMDIIREDCIYARQSVDRKDSISIESQIDFCKYELKGGSCKVFKDKGYSGKNTDRPEFKKLLGEIRKGKVRRVIVYKLDRISRSILDFANMMELFQEYDVEFVSSTEKFDTSTPMGRAMLNICIVFAQLERETIQKRVTDAYYSRCLKGFHMSGQAPYGYQLEPTVVEGIRTKKMVADPKTAQYVKLMFEMYSEPETSFGDITRYFEEQNIKVYGKSLFRTFLSQLLRNPVYAQADLELYEFFKSQGAAIVNDASDFAGTNGCYLYQGRDVKEDKDRCLKDQILVIAPHEALIPSDVWLKCRKKLMANKTFQQGRKPKNTWLAGKVKCGRCGYALKATHVPNSPGYFRCTKRTENKGCPGCGKIHKTELEEFIFNAMRARFKNFQVRHDREEKANPKLTAYQIELAQVETEIEVSFRQNVYPCSKKSIPWGKSPIISLLYGNRNTHLFYSQNRRNL